MIPNTSLARGKHTMELASSMHSCICSLCCGGWRVHLPLLVWHPTAAAAVTGQRGREDAGALLRLGLRRDQRTVGSAAASGRAASGGAAGPSGTGGRVQPVPEARRRAGGSRRGRGCSLRRCGRLGWRPVEAGRCRWGWRRGGGRARPRRWRGPQPQTQTHATAETQTHRPSHARPLWQPPPRPKLGARDQRVTERGRRPRCLAWGRMFYSCF